MKKLMGTLAIVTLATRLLAQSNAPVRLALIAETGEASAASDVLTAQLSSNQKIQLLERNEIEKVYREQGLSAANKDYLKLGRILGADGLLLFDVVRTPQATNLTTRLIAVKPGVVLTDGSFSWPLTNTIQWVESAAPYLNSFLPKLALLPKDVIPISVVNLRSAVQSADAEEAERQLKLLTIQRLSRERQFFVLERQRMQLLGEEKELKADESAFWNGSYLLEGVVDQNGYSKDVITINARVTPPKGGAPLLFETSGSRTNLSEVINRLAAKVTELLKVNSAIKEWNADDEAQQFYDEAKWALKWGVYSEAQAAADSAWALGKGDLDCALVRVQSYISEVSAKVERYQAGENIMSPGFYADGKPAGPLASDADVQSYLKELSTQHPLGLTCRIYDSGKIKTVEYVFADRLPAPKNIDRAIHALELYYAFSRTSSADIFKIASTTSNWRNSDWYNLGIEALVAASQVLQNFNFVPESQKPVADKLAELRSLTRVVSGWISKVPLVHDSYYVGDRVAVYDELANTIGEDGQRNPNVFSCEARWGCLWQETPEDGVALYRELMSSAVFSYVHDKFWLRGLQTPRLVAWNAEDRKRIPTVWTNFIQELNASTNVLWRLEAKALSLADAGDEAKMAASFTNLFNSLFENRDALVANNVDVLYADWGVGALVSAKTGNGIGTATKESLNNLYWHEYRSKLEAMDREYRDKTVAERQNGLEFEKQKRYLKESKPFDFQEFVQHFAFSFKDYSKAQALEIQPLVAAYKSNLMAQSKSASGIQRGEIMGGIAQVGFLEDEINRVLNPPARHPPSQPKVEAPHTAVETKAAVAMPIATKTPVMVTNVIRVNKFSAIPWERLIQFDRPGQFNNEFFRVTVMAHHWLEGKLLLNFQYHLFDKKTGRSEAGPAIAILDPTTEHWDVMACPEADIMSQNNFYHSTALLKGDLYYCEGRQIRKYDFATQQWQALKISDGNNYELFAVNGKLYAASGNTIFEITDGGNGTRLLASTRRNPAVSKLDRENLGTPTLFGGPNQSLRVCTAEKIFTWTGDDWREDCATPSASSPPEIFVDGLLFRQGGALNAGYQNGVIFRQANGAYGTLVNQDEFFQLAKEANKVTFCFKGRSLIQMLNSRTDENAKPLWEMPANVLPNLPAALHQTTLYIFEDSFAVHAMVNNRGEIRQEEAVTNVGYNAALLCFSPDFPLPQKLFLKFDESDAKTSDCTWMFPTTNFLFFGSKMKAGVWLLPLSEIENAATKEKQIQIRERAEKAAVAEQAKKSLLAKYDRNHNGVMDPEEKEEALDDPAFIESELDLIHTNHNGWLNPEELANFDANHNNIFDPKEQSGIDIAEYLLAARLIKEFDADDDGRLDLQEFNSLDQARRNIDEFSPPSPFPDSNHDGFIDPNELKNYLEEQLLSKLRRHGMPGILPGRVQMDTNHSPVHQQLFKSAVEAYWRNPGTNSDSRQSGKTP